MRTLEIPATAYHVPPQGPDQVEVASFDVQGAGSVNVQGTVTLSLVVPAKTSGPPDLHHVLIGIAVPRMVVISSVGPNIPGTATITRPNEIVWRLPVLPANTPSNPSHDFTLTVKPAVAGVLRIAFTGRAGSLKRTFEHVWDHTVTASSA